MLLDVGGVFFLPVARSRCSARWAGPSFSPPAELLDRAHYAGAAQLDTVTVDTEWPQYWDRYLDGYLTACDVPDELRDERARAPRQRVRRRGAVVARSRPVRARVCARSTRPACASGSSRTPTARSNSGSPSTRSRRSGAGLGVEVECVIDSSAVGVTKPDPRIFEIALDAMGVAAADAWYVGDMPGIDVVGARNAGLRPFLMDPFQLHLDADCDRVASLSEVAALIRTDASG